MPRMVLILPVCQPLRSWSKLVQPTSKPARCDFHESAFVYGHQLSP